MSSQFAPRKLWIKFKAKLTKVKTQNCDDVDDLRREAHSELKLEYAPADYNLHAPGDECALKLSRRLSDIPGLEKNSEDNPLIIQLATSPQISRVSTTKFQTPAKERYRCRGYKQMIIEASQRKSLKAIAYKLSQRYNFDWAYSASMGDVLKAIEEHTWNIREVQGTPLTTVRLLDIFGEGDPHGCWAELKEMDRMIQIYDTDMLQTSHGRSLIILPRREFTEEKVSRLKRIALETDVVLAEGYLI
ncbi:hypothetical protein HK102_012221, partial [Quaeritorhiza haematococci]